MVEVEVKSAKGRKTGKVGGAGETQLEIEKYNIKIREAKLRKELNSVMDKRDHMKLKRNNKHSSLPIIALVGYTNAGKTALINMLCKERLESEDKLFMTLDTTARKLRLPNGQNAQILDTVGFITNLPHGLVDSFKATLEELH